MFDPWRVFCEFHSFEELVTIPFSMATVTLQVVLQKYIHNIRCSFRLKMRACWHFKTYGARFYNMLLELGSKPWVSIWDSRIWKTVERLYVVEELLRCVVRCVRDRRRNKVYTLKISIKNRRDCVIIVIGTWQMRGEIHWYSIPWSWRKL